MALSVNKTLYIFIDESGNFDFSLKGTRYFVLTAVSTTEPSLSRERFLQLKYEMLKDGLCEESFHATEDSQLVRDAIFEQIRRTDNFSIDAIIAQKNKANPSLYIKREIVLQHDPKNQDIKTVRTEESFYRLISQTLLKYIFNRYDKREDIDQIVVVLGSLFNATKQGYVLKSLKQFLKKTFDKPFRIYFHPACSDINCQIADYCGWAIYVSVTRNEQRPLSVIRPHIASMFDIFRTGINEFY